MVALLRRYTSDEKTFTRFVQKLDLCVREKKPIESLAGHVITKETLALCLNEVRPICEFAVRPGEIVVPSPSPFMQCLEKLKGGHDVDPDSIHYEVLYAQLAVDSSMTLAKAWGAFQCAR